MHLSTKNVLNKIVNFVLVREKNEGGFGATPLLPATIEDTYYAVKILYLCDYHQLNKEKLKNFLLKQNILELYIEPLAKFFKLLNYLNLLNSLSPHIIDACQKKLKTSFYKNSTDLEKLCFLSEIFEILQNSDFVLKIKNEVLNKISLFNLKTVKSYYYLYKIVKKDFPVEFLTDILEAQNADGGFGFFKGTTSYIENTYYACYILKHFNYKPKNLTKLREFIFSCWNADGGFGRNSQGISSLESTFYALWILKNLNLF